MARELDPAFQDIFGAQKDELMAILEDLLQRGGVSFAERGETGRGRAETRQSALEDLMRQLGSFRGELGVRQLGREQQVADVAGARKEARRMTFAQWQEQRKTATTAFGRQKELIGIREGLARERESRAKKDARRNLIRSMVTQGVLGFGAGMLMPGAVGVDIAKGGSRLQAGFRGLAVGPQAVGTSAAFRWGTQPFQQTQQLQQPQFANPIFGQQRGFEPQRFRSRLDLGYNPLEDFYARLQSNRFGTGRT